MSNRESILEISWEELRRFLLRDKNYFNNDIPKYFSFSPLIKKLSDEITSLKFTDYSDSYPSKCEGVNYKLLTNKDWNFEWRPLDFIHPFIYSYMVNLISDESNWNEIKDRFEYFKNNSSIEVLSIPLFTEEEENNTWEQIKEWWEEVELKSISLWLEYKYLASTDISNCYPSFYTHSIAWALHGRETVKSLMNDTKEKRKLLWDKLDLCIQNQNHSQTNWIPQWSMVMDLIAEIILWYWDTLIQEEIASLDIWNDYKILRYRDDYKVFTNNKEKADLIIQSISKALNKLWLKLSKNKTFTSSDITKASIKEDKYSLLTKYPFYSWLEKTLNNCLMLDDDFEKTKLLSNINIIKFLYFIKWVSEDYPNSGALSRVLDVLRQIIEANLSEARLKREIIVSLVINIMLSNSRVHIAWLNIFSDLNSDLDIEAKEDLYLKVKKRISKMPNNGYFEIWLQRMEIKGFPSENFEYECKLCHSDANSDFSNLHLWESSWLKEEYRNMIEEHNIVDEEEKEKLSVWLSRDEYNPFWEYN